MDTVQSYIFKSRNWTNNMSNEVKLNDKERQRCEVWTRVMGYHRPVQSYNIGKKGEFEERKYFTEAKVKQQCDNKE